MKFGLVFFCLIITAFCKAQESQDHLSLRNLGVKYFEQGQYDDAKSQFIQIDSLIDETDSIAAEAYYWLGRIAYVQRKGSAGIAWLDKAIQWFELNQDQFPLFYLKSCEWLGNIYRYALGNPYEALPWFEKALYFLERDTSIDDDGQRRLTYSLAATYRIMRKTEEAITFGLKSLVLARRNPENHIRIASHLNLMGVIFMSDRKPEQAEAYYQEALALISNQSNLRTRELRYRSNLADVYRDMNHLSQALELQLENLKILRSMPDPDPGLLGNTYYVLAKISRKQDDLKAFDLYISKAIATFKSAYEDVPAIVTEMYAYRSWVHEKNPRLSLSLADSALQCLWSGWSSQDLKAMDFPKDIHSENLFVALGRRAKALRNIAKEQEAEMGEALRYHELALEAYQQYRLTFLQQRSASNQAEEYGWLLEETLETVMLAWHSVESAEDRYQLLNLAWQAMEIGKSFSLHRQFMGYQARTAELLSDDALEKYRLLTGLQRRYRRLNSTDSLYQVERQLNLWHQEVAKTFPAYSKYLLQTNLYSLDSIQATIGQSKALITFLECEHAFYALTTSSDSSMIWQVNKSALADELDFYEDFLKNPFPENISIIKAEKAVKAGFDLYQYFIEPALTSTVTGLVVLPHGRLEQLSIEAFLTAGKVSQPLSFERYPYLIREKSVQYAYSGSHWVHSNKRSSNQQSPDVAGFAWGAKDGLNSLPALPASDEEVLTSIEIWKGTTFVGTEATESAFRKALGTKEVLHVATHGISDPELSAPQLIFPGTDSQHDGVFHLYELMAMNITTDLAILSACETADGDFQIGEGLQSMSRGFAWAGCKSIISNLWPSFDGSASEIMINFHHKLKEGAPLADALRFSKLEYLSSAFPKEGHPSRWAGVILVGDWDYDDKNNFGTIFLLGLSVLALLFIIYKMIHMV